MTDELNVAEQVVTKIEPGSGWRRYEEYKDTGITWLGHIPGHWTEKKLKWESPVYRGASPRPIDDPKYFDDDGEFSWVRIADVTAAGMYLDRTTQKLSELGASLSVKMSPGEMFLSIAGSVGKPCITNIQCCIHDGFVYFPRLKADRHYLYYIFASGEPYRGLGKLGTQLNLNTDIVGDMVLPFPPLNEQRQIAAFLDRETAKIDELVAKKRRLIELLKEKRTALISQAVTKGLDASTEMKDSGVAWLGKVPTTWDVLSLRYVTKVQTGLTLGKKYKASQQLESHPYLRVANVQDGYLDLKEITEVDIPTEDAPRYLLQSGDVLMTEGGDFDKLGRGYVWEGQVPGCLHQNHIFAVRPMADRLHPEFLASLLTSYHGKTYFTSTSSQTTNLATTNSTKLKEFPVLVPPQQEQRNILDFVRQQAIVHEALERTSEKAIGCLQEYRSALISAAVTGKIDVREATE
ncbi:restriction endonuclease subunit S [Aeoliella sp. ICT_H6.2]|uniref:Restriction endonuclease subunit S n=1 Tax=Aeoliella straminimaris TaxID=2954799 RepID=A0A9X2JGB1_9BACT|nr:restriction endonuclease subunit S [Aeoliella straminimaris]MCO6043333.1 restriction endonuclease subunit S [Aeoliella straminimaris]